MLTGKGGENGRNWEIGIDTYTLLILCIKQITSKNLLFNTENSLVRCGDLNRKEVQKGMVVGICVADSFCYAVETSTSF